MNNKMIYVGILILLLAVISCNKFLTIPPHQIFTSDIATSTLDGLTKTAIGEFNQLQSGNLYSGGIIVNSEFMADFTSADPIADYSFNQLRTRQLDANNAQAGGTWGDAYRAIYIANIVLKYAPNFDKQDPVTVQQIKGQSFFIRGIMHFELLRLFAQPSGFTADDSHLGVPIILTPGDISQGQNTPRSTVAQCYAQIEKDLDSAITLLPADPNAFASQGAAQAFLMRMYFTQHKYSQALTSANAIINSGYYSLNPNLNLIDSIQNTTTTPETIFQMISFTGNTSATVQDISNGTVNGNFKAIFKHGATLRCSDAFKAYYRADSLSAGLRAKHLYHYVALNLSHTVQYLYTSKYDNTNVNLPIIRYAEVLLTRAECNARTAGVADATVRADYNLIRVRGGVTPDNTTSGQTALLNAIWAERDYELAYEGDRFFEIKRRQISFVSAESLQTFAWNSSQLVFPIPLQEVQQNTKMVQNPGY